MQIRPTRKEKARELECYTMKDLRISTREEEKQGYKSSQCGETAVRSRATYPAGVPGIVGVRVQVSHAIKK